MATLEECHLPPPDICNVPSTPLTSGKRLVTIVHDETAFNANEDQPFVWGDDNTQCLKPKGRGSGIMVSDFVDEPGDFCDLVMPNLTKQK